jgi:hypothetical protein
MKPLMFGDFIAAAYDACGKRNAGEMVRFAVNARLVEFLGRLRIEISSVGNGARIAARGRF